MMFVDVHKKCVGGIILWEVIMNKDFGGKLQNHFHLSRGIY